MATPPYNLNIDYFVGDTTPVSLGLSDAATGRAYNLAGATDARFMVKATEATADNAAVISRTLASGIAISDATGATTGGEASIVDITPTLAESLALAPGTSYFAFLRVKNSAGQWVTAARGYFNTGASAPLTLP